MYRSIPGTSLGIIAYFAVSCDDSTPSRMNEIIQDDVPETASDATENETSTGVDSSPPVDSAPADTVVVDTVVADTVVVDAVVADTAVADTVVADTAPPMSCKGTVKNCGQFANDGTLCVKVDGCSFTADECAGTATPCGQFSGNFYNCTHQPNCQYFDSNNQCSGYPPACFIQNSDYLCSRVKGCTWKPSKCSGQAKSCDEMTSVEACEGQFGCTWQ